MASGKFYSFFFINYLIPTSPYVALELPTFCDVFSTASKEAFFPMLLIPTSVLCVGKDIFSFSEKLFP